MKITGIFFFIVILIILMMTSFYSGSCANNKNIKIVQDTLIKYQDGIYEGQSRHIYTGEPFWGRIRIAIENGSFTRVNFMIRDSNLHETFTRKYKKHYKGNPEYIQQVKNDSKGVKTYSKKLIKTQDINKIDATSGATWSYNIFRASAGEALRKAVKK